MYNLVVHNRTAELPKLDDQLCVAVYRAAHAFTAVYRDLLAPSGLSYPQYVTMVALWQSENPLTVRELGEQLALDSGTLSPLLRRLEAAGYLERRRDEQDGRLVRLHLTQEGLDLQAVVLDVPGRLAACLGGTAEQGRVLIDALHTVTDNLRSATGDLRDHHQTKDSS